MGPSIFQQPEKYVHRSYNRMVDPSSPEQAIAGYLSGNIDLLIAVIITPLTVSVDVVKGLAEAAFSSTKETPRQSVGSILYTKVIVSPLRRLVFSATVVLVALAVVGVVQGILFIRSYSYFQWIPHFVAYTPLLGAWVFSYLTAQEAVLQFSTYINPSDDPKKFTSKVSPEKELSDSKSDLLSTMIPEILKKTTSEENPRITDYELKGGDSGIFTRAGSLVIYEMLKRYYKEKDESIINTLNELIKFNPEYIRSVSKQIGDLTEKEEHECKDQLGLDEKSEEISEKVLSLFKDIRAIETECTSKKEFFLLLQ